MIALVLVALIAMLIAAFAGLVVAFQAHVLFNKFRTAMKAITIPLILISGVLAPVVTTIETHSGTHVGYVTAVETGGILFKTNAAYIKTTTESSQEDQYCATDEVFDALEAFSRNGQRVEIGFTEHIGWAPECPFDGNAVIRSVRPITGGA